MIQSIDYDCDVPSIIISIVIRGFPTLLFWQNSASGSVCALLLAGMEPISYSVDQSHSIGTQYFFAEKILKYKIDYLYNRLQ